MELKLLGAVLLSAVAAFIESYFDAKKKNTNHTISAIVRVVVAYIISFAMIVSFDTQLVFTTILLAVYWIVFDPSYNYFRGVKWDYIGETAWTDRMARKTVKNGSSYLYVKIWFLSVLFVGFLLI